ncbi:unnamed protein product [Paramecium sonneborni]|uniref:Uncharacterized protein n=1 Tax=Paramecium sonneborni TaxID=65129 RepID=A0A8S1K3X2_9CILI|nr:unnamed protein product [Paramecium sonneborni]
MKQYQKLLECQGEQYAQNYNEKNQVEKLIKEENNNVPQQSYQKIQRLSLIRDKYQQKLIQQQLETVSTVNSGFDKVSNDNQLKSISQLFNPLNKEEQSQTFLIKHQMIAKRIISAQPIRHLIMKKISDQQQLQQFENLEQKKPFLILRNLGGNKIQYQGKDLAPINEQINQNQNISIFKRSSRIRTQSQSHEQYQNYDQQEQQNNFDIQKSFKISKMKNNYDQKEMDEQYDSLDREQLQQITKMKESEFHQITQIEFRFNAIEGSLYQLGEFLINLQELTLDYSNIESLRLLGTKLSILQILNIRKSNLSDLSGISSMPNLIELNCSFNNISDVSPLAFHPKIVKLDLEANQLADENQLDYIESLNLQYLNILNNPLLQDKNLSDIIYQRFNSFNLEREKNPQISNNSYQDLQRNQNQMIQIPESKSFLEDQQIKQLEILLDDLEKKNQSQKLNGKNEKHKLKRPQTAQIKQIELQQTPKVQHSDSTNLMIKSNFQDSQKKSQQKNNQKKVFF